MSAADKRDNVLANSVDTLALKINGVDKTTTLNAVTGTNTGDETGARIATLLHASSNKGSIVDADEVNGTDSANSFSLIRTTWTQVKAFLKTYLDTLYLTATSTNTLTNKRITKRISAEASNATPSVNTDNFDGHRITALSANMTSFTASGTPTDGQIFLVSITDNGTARTLAWGANFESSGNAIIPTTTVLGVRLDVAFIWNVATSKWRCIAVA
jgi:hypothetical protein